METHYAEHKTLCASVPTKDCALRTSADSGCQCCRAVSMSSCGLRFGTCILPANGKDHDRTAHQRLCAEPSKEYPSEPPFFGFGLFDGHGLGPQVADLVATSLVPFVARQRDNHRVHPRHRKVRTRRKSHALRGARQQRDSSSLPASSGVWKRKKCWGCHLRSVKMRRKSCTVTNVWVPPLRWPWCKNIIFIQRGGTFQWLGWVTLVVWFKSPTMRQPVH